jgi:hypothetical protein
VKILLNIPTPFLCGRLQATRRIRPGSRDDLSREFAQTLPRVVYKFIVALWLERLSFDGVKTEAAGQGATIPQTYHILYKLLELTPFYLQACLAVCRQVLWTFWFWSSEAKNMLCTHSTPHPHIYTMLSHAALFYLNWTPWTIFM